MEKTMARAIYKLMEVGKPYSTRQLSDMLGDDYYKYIPVNQHPGQPDGMPVSQMISAEMWKVVKTGYAKTYTEKDRVGNVRGLRYGTEPKSYTEFTVRYWVRAK